MMHRDRVLVRPEQKRHGDSQGHVVEVLERGQRLLVGVIQADGDRTLLVPMDPRVAPAIPLTASGPLPTGQVAAVEMTRYGSGYAPAEARLQRLLGSPDDPEVQAQAVIFRYGWPEDFSDEARQEAERHGAAVDPRELHGRRDLRALTTFTVDGETARDFDDAVSIERTAAKGYRLYVSIADVAHYVPRGSVLDGEAHARGTSVYFPDRALPMLPPVLSTGICSLKPETDRLARTALLEINRKGEVERTELFPSAIHSLGPTSPTPRSDKSLWTGRVGHREIPGARRAPSDDGGADHLLMDRRRARGSLDFELPDTEILLDDHNMPTDIRRTERTIAHRMIEEFMIAATRPWRVTCAGGNFLASIGCTRDPTKTPSMPSARFCPPWDTGCIEVRRRFSSGEIQRVLEACRGKPEERVLNRMLLRSMKQATYDPENIGHFGLASEAYLQFHLAHTAVPRPDGPPPPGSGQQRPQARFDDTGRARRLPPGGRRPQLPARAPGDGRGAGDGGPQEGPVHDRQDRPGPTPASSPTSRPSASSWSSTAGSWKDWSTSSRWRTTSTAITRPPTSSRGKTTAAPSRMGDAVTVRVARVKLFQGEIDFELT